MINKNKRIPVFKPKYRTKENLSALKEIFDSGWTGIGNKTIQFENEWKKRCDNHFSFHLRYLFDHAISDSNSCE